MKFKGVSYHVRDDVDTGNPSGLERRETNRLEDGVGINGDTSDTNPLLQNLKPDDKLDTTADVQMASRLASHEFGEDVPEHVEVAVDLSGLFLHVSNVSDVLVFNFGRVVFIGATEAE